MHTSQFPAKHHSFQDLAAYPIFIPRLYLQVLDLDYLHQKYIDNVACSIIKVLIPLDI